MHYTALELAKTFFKCYVGNDKKRILEVGSQDVNGSLREVAPNGSEYVGLDYSEGPGVDVVLTDPYSFPFEPNSFDCVVSSSCFEHSEFFWLLFNEILRVLKNDGICYINVPSNGSFHQFPVDCWRFYPDSGFALEKWSHSSGYSTVMLESFIGKRKKSYWNDFVAVFLKDVAYLDNYDARMLDGLAGYYNGYRRDNFGKVEMLNYSKKTEDQMLIDTLRISEILKK